MQKLLWVCAGGALGSGARYLVQLGAARIWGEQFPWGTLLCNVVGCLLMGAAAVCFEAHSQMNPALRLALTTGVLGGFTTYSAYNQQLILLWHTRGASITSLYLSATIMLCLVAAVLGHQLAKHFTA